MVITIDGPSSSGKSTVADLVAKKLNINHLNSGEFYRAISYYLDKQNISPTDTKQIAKTLKNIKISAKFVDEKQLLILNGEDITHLLHNNHINSIVSKYGKLPCIIKYASKLTKQCAKTNSIVIDGRNVGSFIIKNTPYKFYLDCKPEIRAERRLKEELSKGANVSFDEILKQTIERDTLDKTRKLAPLVVPKGAFIVDSSYLSIDEVVNKICDIINNINK